MLLQTAGTTPRGEGNGARRQMWGEGRAVALHAAWGLAMHGGELLLLLREA